MRRIARIQQQPSAVLTRCLHSQPTHSIQSRAAAATSYLPSRPRDFATKTKPPGRSRETPPESAADRRRAIIRELRIEEMVAESRPTVEPAAPAQGGDQAVSAESAPAEISSSSFSSSLDALESLDGADDDPQTIVTDLVLPPTNRAVAPRADDLDPDEYTKAESAAGLPVLGGLTSWFSEAKDHWGPSKSFTGFANETRVTDRALLEVCARRAVLEALAIQSAGVQGLLVDSWRADGAWEPVLSLGLTVDAEGKATLEGDVKEVVAGLVGDVGARPTMMPVDQAREINQVTNSSWKLILLRDTEFKFAVAKRIFQLTGQAIPDAKLVNVSTMGGLLATVVKPEPSRRVYEAVQRRGELAKLPNVSVYQSRRTPVDVAKDLGRWKVVEKELEKRGLPVLGPDSVDKFRETEWFHGPQPEKKDKKKGRRRH